MREKDGVVLHDAAGGRIASLHGELDLFSMPEFERRLVDALAGGDGYLAVDLSPLEFMDSQGIHMLSRIRDMALELDRRFYVVCEGGACRRVLDAVGAENIFNLKSSRQELEELETAPHGGALRYMDIADIHNSHTCLPSNPRPGSICLKGTAG